MHDHEASSTNQHGCQVFVNSKEWLTSNIVVKWLQYNFAFNTEPVLLLLDGFTDHKTEDVLATAKSLNLTIMSIPPGLTSKAQPADLSWNKPFKGHMRQIWTAKLENDLKNMPNFRATAPNREWLISWINKS